MVSDPSVAVSSRACRIRAATSGFINLKSSLVEKWLELLKEVAPRLPRVTAAAIGTNAKCRLHQAMSEFKGKAENICSV
jgi:hypothetical protein